MYIDIISYSPTSFFLTPFVHYTLLKFEPAQNTDRPSIHTYYALTPGTARCFCCTQIGQRIRSEVDNTNVSAPTDDLCHSQMNDVALDSGEAYVIGRVVVAQIEVLVCDP